MKAYVKLFQELDRCEFVTDYEYKGNIDDYEYNGIAYSQSSAFYYDYLNNLYNDFLVEWSSLLGEDDKTAVRGMMNLIRTKRYISGDFYYDVPSLETVEGMKKDNVPAIYVKMAFFVCDMAAQQKFFLNQLKNFFEGNGVSDDECQKTSNDNGVGLPTPMNNVVEISTNLYQKLHEKYGDTMTVKQLCGFFHVSARTVANWELKGLVTNISETSNEYTAIGHKKRGDEKRYLTSDIATNIELQRKFSKL